MANEQYIKILPPFSLNKEWDAADPEFPPGNFQTLKNYVPESDILRTRKGITTFAHTATVAPPFDPATDPNVIMWTRFESNPGAYTYNGSAAESIDDDIQGSDFWICTSGNSYSASTAWKEEGSASMYIDYYLLPGAGLNRGFWVEGTSLETLNFPGFTNNDSPFIMTFWFRPTWRDEKTLRFSRHDSTQAGAFYMGIVTAAGGTYKFQIQLANSVGVTRSVTANTSMYGGISYHLAIWNSPTLGNSGLVVWDDTNATETSVLSSPALVVNGQYTASATRRMTLQVYRSGRAYFDDFIVTNDDFATEAEYLTRIQNIRNRT